MNPIFITGCARSGTSLVAGIVARSGAWGGNICGATAFNPKGQYENTEIRNTIIKPLLTLMKADPMGQNPLPSMETLLKFVDVHGPIIRKKVDSIMRRQGYVNHVPWYFKGAKMCLIWPIWMNAYPDAKYIIVTRPDKLIIDSCMATSFMRKRSNRDQWQEWIDIHKKRFDEMHAHNSENLFTISSLDLVEGRRDDMKDCIEKIGLTWNEKEINDFISPEVWNKVT